MTLNALTCTVHLTPCDGIKNMAAIALQFKSNVNLISAMLCCTPLTFFKFVVTALALCLALVAFCDLTLNAGSFLRFDFECFDLYGSPDPSAIGIYSVVHLVKRGSTYDIADCTPLTFFKFVVTAFALCLALVACCDLTLNALTWTVPLTPCEFTVPLDPCEFTFTDLVPLPPFCCLLFFPIVV